MLCTYFVGSFPAPSFKSSGRVAIAVVVVPERGLPEEHVEVRKGLSLASAHWEALLLGLSAGRGFGFSRLPIQCSQEDILKILESPIPAKDPAIEAKRQKALESSKQYDSVHYFHCQSESNPAIDAARRIFQDRTFRLAATLTGRQTLCMRAPSLRHAKENAKTELWPSLDQLVRFEGLDLDDLDIQDVKPKDCAGLSGSCEWCQDETHDGMAIQLFECSLLQRFRPDMRLARSSGAMKTKARPSRVCSRSPSFTNPSRSVLAV